jgi:hypothetical protein
MGKKAPTEREAPPRRISNKTRRQDRQKAARAPERLAIGTLMFVIAILAVLLASFVHFVPRGALPSLGLTVLFMLIAVGVAPLVGKPRAGKVKLPVDGGEAERVVKVRVGEERAPSPPRARVVCVECGEEGGDPRASCDLCADALHDGPCALRHAARHEGATGGTAYR